MPGLGSLELGGGRGDRGRGPLFVSNEPIGWVYLESIGSGEGGRCDVCMEGIGVLVVGRQRGPEPPGRWRIARLKAMEKRRRWSEGWSGR